MNKTKQEINKTYYEKHYKDKIYATLTKKVCCFACNFEMMLCNVSKHRKTKKHLANQQKFQKIELN